METQYARTEALIGADAVRALKGKRVAIFGIGGVGGYAAEALARSGVGALDLIDADRVSLTNINRQIIATHKTVGEYKTEVMKSRIHDIDPTIDVRTFNVFFDNNTLHLFNFSDYDYVVDAIDSVKSKIELIASAKAVETPVIISGGAGNKLDPTAFTVADISKTEVCPLCRAVRTELKKRGIKGVKAVFSKEMPVCDSIAYESNDTSSNKADTHPPQGTAVRHAPASIAFVPSVVGLIMASEVVKDLIKE